MLNPALFQSTIIHSSAQLTAQNFYDSTDLGFVYMRNITKIKIERINFVMKTFNVSGDYDYVAIMSLAYLSFADNSLTPNRYIMSNNSNVSNKISITGSKSTVSFIEFKDYWVRPNASDIYNFRAGFNVAYTGFLTFELIIQGLAYYN